MSDVSQTEVQEDDWWEVICYMAHYFPNPSLFNIEKMSLRQFMEAKRIMVDIIKSKRPQNGSRDFVNQQMEDILNNPEKMREILEDPDIIKKLIDE